MNIKDKKGLDWLAMYINGTTYIPNTSPSQDQQIVAQIYSTQSINFVVFSTVSITVAITVFFGIENDFSLLIRSLISASFVILSIWFVIKSWASNRCLRLLMSFLGKI